MIRKKDLPDYFTYRGNRMPFHRLADGPSLGRLDPYAGGEQAWPMLSGHEISVTAEEIRDITYQVMGITLPPIDPRDTSALEARIERLEALLAGLSDVIVAPVAAAETEAGIEPDPVPEPEPEPQPDPRDDELEALRARVRELEAREPVAVAVDDGGDFPAPDDLMFEWADKKAEDDLKPKDLIELVPQGDAAIEDVISKLSRSNRKRFTELLNVELAELEQDRGTRKEDRPREAKIQRLLGIFARVGEKM